MIQPSDYEVLYYLSPPEYRGLFLDGDPDPAWRDNVSNLF